MAGSSAVTGAIAPSTERRFFDPSSVGYSKRETSVRRHPGLRCRRAHASDRRAVAHGSSKNSLGNQWLVFHGIWHAGGLRGQACASAPSSGGGCGRWGFPDDGGRVGDGQAFGLGCADYRSQRWLARTHEGKTGAEKLSAFRCLSRGARGYNNKIIGSSMSTGENS